MTDNLSQRSRMIEIAPLDELIETIEELGEGDDILLLEPRSRYDAAIVGVVERFHDTFVLYDHSAVMRILMEDDDMTEEDAMEWYSFNMSGGWYGAGTWGFLFGTKVLDSDQLADFPDGGAR